DDRQGWVLVSGCTARASRGERHPDAVPSDSSERGASKRRADRATTRGNAPQLARFPPPGRRKNCGGGVSRFRPSDALRSAAFFFARLRKYGPNPSLTYFNIVLLSKEFTIKGSDRQSPAFTK